jgi:riboflavin kinase / FMN adenylyltransferase
MTLYSSLSETLTLSSITELALGFFDGLHLGHREVLVGTRTPAELGSRAVLSFSTHPQSVLYRDTPITLITGLPHKQRLLETWGLQHLILLPFNLEISKKSPECFLTEIHGAFPALRSIRVGENFRFGHQRQGTPDYLVRWGQQHKLHIERISSVLQEGKAISSSRIRSLLQQRNLRSARDLLGRPYSLYGRVQEGERLGTRLGFPTANLKTEDGHLLPKGVYAGYANTEQGQRYRAAINLGTRPSVSSGASLSIEAHLLDFSGNLYGQQLDLEMIDFIREEIKFNSSTELVCQITKDVDQVLNILPPPIR